MATSVKVAPKTRVDYFRARRRTVDTSVQGTPQDRAAHQLKTLEDWRPIRAKVGK